MNQKKPTSVYRKYDDDRSVSVSILPKRDRALKTRKALLLLLYVAFIGIWATLLAVLQTYAMYIGAFSMLSLLVLVFFTWRYASPEYEISVHEGQFCAAVIYGGLTRKELYTCAVRDFTSIAPCPPEAIEALETLEADRRLVMVSGTGREPVYLARARSADGSTVLLCFDTGEKLQRLLKYYGGDAFRA
ncbi:MAG TPA: hypothetical protein DDW30_05325 [Clostridiales bacterium]|mgnify:CR=1 FL=1|nr:hypothetical protein [Clostridiales bacterium]